MRAGLATLQKIERVGAFETWRCERKLRSAECGFANGFAREIARLPCSATCETARSFVASKHSGTSRRKLAHIFHAP